MESLISTYGYAAVALGTFLEGETSLLLAGFAAQRGLLELHWVVVAAFLGTLAADQLYFNLGRVGGGRLLARRPRWQEKSARVLALLERHQTLVILSYRFIYGIRTVAPFVIGLSGVSRVRYLLLTMLSTAVWATLIGGLGFLFGKAIERALAEMKRYELWGVVALVAVGLAGWAIYFMRERARRARRRAEGTSP